MLAHSGLEDCEQGLLLMEVSNHFQRFAGIALTIAPIPMNNVASSLPHRAGLVPMPWVKEELSGVSTLLSQISSDISSESCRMPG